MSYNQSFLDAYERIEKFIRSKKGSDVLIEKLDPVDPYNINHIEQVINSYISKSENKDFSWVFNITGGTKTMSIAAYNVAFNFGSEVVYVESNNHSILHYSKNNTDPEIRNFDESLFKDITVEKYLELNGRNNVTFKDISDNDILLSCIIFNNIDSINSSVFLKNVQNECRKFYKNDKGKDDKKKLNKEYCFEIKDDCRPNQDEDNLLKKLSDFGILKYDGNSVVFENNKKYKFFEGTWLEAYTKKCLSGKFFDDIKSNIEFGGKREFDLAVIGQTRFGMIECKSSSKIIDAKDFAKLDSTNSRHGIHAKSFFIICEEYDETKDKHKGLEEQAGWSNVTIIWKNDFYRMDEIISKKLGIML